MPDDDALFAQEHTQTVESGFDSKTHKRLTKRGFDAETWQCLTTVKQGLSEALPMPVRADSALSGAMPRLVSCDVTGKHPANRQGFIQHHRYKKK
ncbi:hypothetical protein WJ542_27120 [Paraburkholderia sp. B3]|uniref:hypothetical protein n=1 Tax=Paraburkholderia sp. B3 TaxID=3134791 RepID=UPI0039828F21